MDISDYLPPRPWMQRKDSFSSLKGLEIAIPPGQKAPVSPGASPAIPLKSPPRSLRLSYGESYEEMAQDDLASPSSRSSRKVFQLMGVHVDTDTKDPPRTESRMSVSSLESGYSQDGVDEEYVALQPARRPSSVEDMRALQKKGMFYLQAVTYSASASKIFPSKMVPEVVLNQLKSEPLSLRHRDRVQAASPQEYTKSRNGKSKPTAAKPTSPQRSQTLDEMIAYERKRFDAEQFARRMWKPTIGKPQPKTLHNAPKSPPPTKNQKAISSAMGFPYSSTSALEPAPLVIRGKASGREEHRQSISHFSDVSDDESPGMMAHARDSVMSHIRRTVKSPSPTRVKRPVSFSESKSKPAAATRLMIPATQPKRKRFSKGGVKHPLRSPFPSFQNSPKHKKPQWPPPGQPVTRATTPSFSKRLSGVMGRLSTSSGSATGSVSAASGRASTSPISSTIITTESREAHGPDTPMPKSSSSKESGHNKTGLGMPGFMSNITTTPKFMTKSEGGEKSTLLSPKEILEKGGMRFSEAIESARKKAGVRSKAEKRRDHIRANIVKIGAADQFPDGRVSRWV